MQDHDQRGQPGPRGRETDPEAAERAASRQRRRRARKERVLHTRISEDLAEDIRRMAEELRVPVSNIVRNVLEEAFSVVETVTDNVGDLIEDVVDEAEAAAARIRRQRRRRRRGQGEASRFAPSADAGEEPADVEQALEPEDRPGAAGAGPASREPSDDPEVLGWQPMVLARGQVCADCGERLERGDRAHAGVTARGVGAAWLCDACLAERL